MSRRKRESIVYGIPGGWYGNEPGTFPGDPAVGNVVVDGTKAAAAVLWLARRATIEETSIVTHAGPPGLLLKYRLRRPRRESEVCHV